jgi:hypothetical protein
VERTKYPACKSDLGRNFDAVGGFSAFRTGQVGNVPKDPATPGDLFKALDDFAARLRPLAERFWSWQSQNSCGETEFT